MLTPSRYEKGRLFLMDNIMNHIMTCILPLIFSVPLVVLLAGGVTALAKRLEGTKMNSDTLYGTTADSMIRSASEDTHVHGTARSREVTSHAGGSAPLPFP